MKNQKLECPWEHTLITNVLLYCIKQVLGLQLFDGEGSVMFLL